MHKTFKTKCGSFYTHIGKCAVLHSDCLKTSFAAGYGHVTDIWFFWFTMNWDCCFLVCILQPPMMRSDKHLNRPMPTFKLSWITLSGEDWCTHCSPNSRLVSSVSTYSSHQLDTLSCIDLGSFRYLMGAQEALVEYLLGICGLKQTPKTKSFLTLPITQMVEHSASLLNEDH